MMESRYLDLQVDLTKTLPLERVTDDPFRTAVWSADASFYRMWPQVVVTVQSEKEVQHLLAACRKHDTPVTFRAAGTSLSGQAVTDSVLARLGDGWSKIEVHEGGSKVTLGPGVLGGRANEALKPFGKKIGPDPASINAAMIGGIAANNASGMCCGTSQNSYRTLDSLRVILADGWILDTGDDFSVACFAAAHEGMLFGLRRLREEVLANAALTERIRRKFSIKNTTGYGLNALVDFEDPIDILEHLMIGSEGTLGFISEITYRTVPDPRFKAAALAFYESPRAAAEAVIALKDAPLAAVELIDRAGIRSAENKPRMPRDLGALGPEATALLLEVQAESEEGLEAGIERTMALVERQTPLRPVAFSTDPAVCTSLWAFRKGLFPAVGALRETGTAVIIEDVAFPLERLGEAIEDLQRLFRRHRYDDALLFGHARDGNLHVVFSQDFRNDSEIERYARFMDELCEMVATTYQGSLKAEHGTGRNVAPFVELEWGKDALKLMKRIKQLMDPQGILNPGVILTDDPKAHLKHLKDIPAAHPIVDKCTECGFCESHCPSHGLTTSPRQRTVALRVLSHLGTSAAVREPIAMRFGYQALDTCATCGLCATVCPVQIDTGAFVKALRAGQQTPADEAWADWVAHHFGTVKDAAGLGLRAGSLARALFGAAATETMSSLASALTGGALPKWSASVPDGYRFRVREDAADLAVEPVETMVFMPSCVSRTMRPKAATGYHEPLPVIVERLAAHAGVRLIYPEGLRELCCGQPFDTKGLAHQADVKASEVFAAARAAVKGGPIRVLSDTSPCSYRLEKLQPEDVEVVDLVSFLHDTVLPRVDLTRKRKKLAVHATCSIRKLGLTSQLATLARACAEEIVVPADVECCGFAGDRGFSTPELNAHALRHLRGAVAGAEAGCSSSLTCEIGLGRYSGLEYRSIAYFLDEAASA